VVTTICGGFLAHMRSLRLRCIAGANQCADVDIGQIERLQLAANAGQRNGEVSLDIVGERLQR
jgi:hypothetical protein